MYILTESIAGLPASVQIFVRSHGYFLYTLEFQHAQSTWIYSQDGKSPHRFQNLISVKEILGSFPIREAWLIHHSAYDEMVGQPAGSGNELRVPLDLALPY